MATTEKVAAVGADTVTPAGWARMTGAASTGTVTGTELLGVPAALVTTQVSCREPTRPAVKVIELVPSPSVIAPLARVQA